MLAEHVRKGFLFTPPGLPHVAVSCGRTSIVFIDARNDATAQESAHLLPELDALVA